MAPLNSLGHGACGYSKIMKYKYNRNKCWNRLTANITVGVNNKYIIDADAFHGIKSMFLETVEPKKEWICPKCLDTKFGVTFCSTCNPKKEVVDGVVASSGCLRCGYPSISGHYYGCPELTPKSKKPIHSLPEKINEQSFNIIDKINEIIDWLQAEKEL